MLVIIWLALIVFYKNNFYNAVKIFTPTVVFLVMPGRPVGLNKYWSYRRTIGFWWFGFFNGYPVHKTVARNPTTRFPIYTQLIHTTLEREFIAIVRTRSICYYCWVYLVVSSSYSRNNNYNNTLLLSRCAILSIWRGVVYPYEHKVYRSTTA